jgi:mannosylglucosylglycerate synthase
MKKPGIAILHYSAPPGVGGVESVIQAQTNFFVENDYPVLVLAGEGSAAAFPGKVRFLKVPLLNTQNPEVVIASQALEQGYLPENFEDLVSKCVEILTPILKPVDIVIVHNVFSKHFNLAFTAALFRMLDSGAIRHCIAWCHDFTWTSPHSRSKVYPGYPWDLLRTFRPDVTYVTVSKARQIELAGLLGCMPERIRVIYNGVNADEISGLSKKGMSLINRMKLLESALNLIMPVRVTQAKNIELAFQVVASLKKQGTQSKLVITGPPDPHDAKNMEYFQSLLALRDQLQINQEAFFVYQMHSPRESPVINMALVGEIYRVSDALFMPSHREGFGMPILEAGLAGLPIFCTNNIPAAAEIGGQDVISFSPDADANGVAKLILDWKNKSPIYRMRRNVRQNFIWGNLFRRELLPLLENLTH